MRVVLLCNDDLTTNRIFASLFSTKGIEIVAAYFAASPKINHRGIISGAWALLKEMSSRYWVYLMTTNGIFKIFELLTLAFSQHPQNGPLQSIRRYAELHNVHHEKVNDFTASEFVEKIRNLRPDLLIIRVGSILEPELLECPRLGTWCVHSSVLPACKGIAGEFHTLRHKGMPVGTSVFEVTEELDAGPIIAQTTVLRHETDSVYSHMMRNNQAAAGLIKELVLVLSKEGRVDPVVPKVGLVPSYFSWPQGKQVAELRKRGIPLVSLKECFRLLLQALRLR